MKYRIFRNITNLLEYEEEDYYKPIIVGNFWSNSYIEYKSKGDPKTLSGKKYLSKRNQTNLKNSNSWKIQLTTTVNFVSSKDNNDEECVMHSKTDDNIEIMINDQSDELIEELFKSLFNRYQNNLEKLMKGSQFAFNYVHLLHYEYQT